ncbi:ABC transporter permease [Streptomyces griseocarneus]|uniref:ABC transporter permease n=1 Tax=Streptomyces griseocarneus TaxID=51201 RepID=UPI00167F1B17|nr:ABC transporter permease [Streptomyces griseocarneus]MBZ6477161.1 ABC transporter permease [Streptomyces griseocarneus]GHG53862.1 membrane protein [Streptomyces griseocarneus]
MTLPAPTASSLTHPRPASPHADVPDPAPPQHPQGGWKGVLLPVAVVLAIGTIFVSVYLAAFHAPRPHDLPVAVVGTQQEAQRIEEGLESALPGGFDVRPYAGESAAREAVEHRRVYAAYLTGRGHDAPKLLFAGANGPSVTGTLTGAFGPVAGASGHRLAQEDVLPASAGDTRGLSIFYAAFGLVLAGYLFGMMTYQAAPALRLRQRMASLALFGVLGGVIIALLAGSTGFGALPGSFVGIAGITALMAMAAGGATMVFIKWTGSAGAGLASVVLLTLGNATSGGVMPAPYLPGWLHPLSDVLPVSAGVRAIQGLAYFHHDGLGRGIAVLAAWIIACAGLLHLRDARAARSARRP